jgi:Leucine-rich repeat (LRR) protein
MNNFRRKIEMKKFALFIVVLFSFGGKAQLLDSLTLDTVFAYTSIAEAMKNPDAVIKLELKKQKLKEFPLEIFQLKNLQYLDISRNNIKNIPDSLDMLPNLQYFNASKNRIEMMPMTIGKLKELKWMNWNNNDLGSLPPQLGNLDELEYLDLWNNNLSYFPETLGKMKKLRVFDLRHILLNEEQQNRLRDLLPSTNILMDRACNCN